MNQNKIGKIITKEISEEMKESYIDYAMSVIISRALPDVRDGLKPVQRRILYTMYEMGLRSQAKFRKSATVVGECMGKYHPHGDAPIYEALARMAQPFTLRYPLITGQGNFGSIDGDPPASMRYTEAKLSPLGEEMLKDIEKETVEFIPNYDGTRKEPQVLPSPVPNILINGALGIAVGMTTNIPPHNLSEVCDALIYLIDHPKATTEELFQFIQGPDFPTGGEVFNKKEIIKAYSQGKGPIIIRGKTHIEKEGKRTKIVISEIPFQVQKSSLLEQFAKLVQEKKIEGIRDIRDESDKEGMRIVLELAREANYQLILNSLFKFTDLQKTFYLNMLALVDGIQPKILNLVEILECFIDHRREVVIKRTQYELKKAKERAHILEGLKKCLGNIDKAIYLIKTSDNREEAKKKLMSHFKIDATQAEAILETKLASLAKLERGKIENELRELNLKIKNLTEILKSPKKINEEIKKELKELKEKFGDERKTKIYFEQIREIPEEELIPTEDTLIALTKSGYLKRINPKTYKLQKRGGRGVLATKTLGEDFVEQLIFANTKDKLLCFANSGRVFPLPVYEIPEVQKSAKGKNIATYLPLAQNEKILALIPLKKAEEAESLIIITREGIIKKLSLKNFANIKKRGLIAISLNKGDVVKSVKKVKKDSEILIITENGQAIKFNEKEIREMGRGARGIRGIKLKKDDKVASMEVINGEKEILIVTENGFGKRVKIDQFRNQKRGGIGIKAAKITEKTGKIIEAKILKEEKELILLSQKGQMIKVEIKTIPILKREAQGVRIMKLKEDKIAGVSCL
jgi:DNA gyrase subunit A